VPIKSTGHGPRPNPNDVDGDVYDSWLVPATDTERSRHYLLFGIPPNRQWRLSPRHVIQSGDPIETPSGVVRMDEMTRHLTTNYSDIFTKALNNGTQ